MVNTISELLDDQLFEDLDIVGPEVKDLANSNPKIGKALIRLGDILKKKVTLLQCTTDYPTRDEDVNLRAIETMQNEFCKVFKTIQIIIKHLVLT